jgi:phosphate starvation-inducible protein PhoH and related proteins
VLFRSGKNAKFVVTGDLTQIDLPDKKSSGLVMALKILQGIKGISIVEFDQRDIIRHKLVKFIVEAYEKANLPDK